VRGEVHAVDGAILPDEGPADIQADVLLLADLKRANEARSRGVDRGIDQGEVGPDALIVRMHLSVSHHLKQISPFAAIIAGGELRAFPFGVGYNHFTA